ncbi:MULTISPECIES: SRPBCC family protein [Actinokineospora]|uniref:ATPase n=1 Tax=Actinokineospora fastidiosa TaxID=1816 RepID=A0A918GJI4_9PSEU|nr:MULTISPECIES: SRPBCC family protein [Actinokineospora]UVS80752.1 Polyketide cyclase / dehydrase and lipid transport [Actinokineospora sp. UTMC 2448]GGS36896.1 ATPase [Actinokineospora fastidiosa]
MSVDVRPVTLIRRPRAEVAAFMFDPANDLRWTGGIRSSRPDRPGPLTTGMTVERTARFLGRDFTYGYVVTAHEPGRMVELDVERPFPMRIRYELADAEGGTEVAIDASGSPGRFFGLLTPLLRKQVHRAISADLRRLRSCLEESP